jgi:5-methylcytosine-specific restriction endonuclease McrA
MPKTGKTRSKTAHRTLAQMRKHGRTYQASETQKKNRAARGRNRSKLMKEGRVRKGDGKHVDHKKSVSKGGSLTDPKNLRVISARANLRKNNKR